MTTPSHFIFGLIFCILSFYCGAQECLFGTYLIYTKEATPGTPIETIDPPVKIIDFAVTEEGECSVAFILNDATTNSGFFSTLYSMDDQTILKLENVAVLELPPVLAVELEAVATDITYSVLQRFVPAEIITMFWERGATRPLLMGASWLLSLRAQLLRRGNCASKMVARI
ncbi:hypothetical protein FOZ63_010684 [Perkinsus olseni]|uniref:Uncharacterized protein n=1 Tax=Perkinsus olseni TaxID=32597 RepID=A0A7J6TKV6_PEROL|nr:hypothetical protein FOZ63_010684 [Perkinsus olseni]